MRLLLAEDEHSLSRALVRILEHGNYSVDAVLTERKLWIISKHPNTTG